MKLKAKLVKTEFEALPDPIRSAYVPKDDVFVLDVDGMTSDDEVASINTKLAEFRDNNIKLVKDAKRFEGIDPDKYKMYESRVAELEKQGVAKPNDVAQLIAAALEPVKNQLTAMETERNKANEKLQEKYLEDSLWQIGAKAGVDEQAKPYFLMEGKKLFKQHNGQLIAFDGDQQLYSKRKNAMHLPMTAEEWALEQLPTEKPLFFKASNGAGASNKTSTTTNTGRVVSNDPLVLGNNLESIAKGETTVLGTSR
jgi:hypothetical protein